MVERESFDAFVLARWASLVRTAYLLTGEHALAEDLAQTALAKSWFAWDRITDDPMPYVRRVMVTTSVSWWRRRWRAEVPTEVLPEPRTQAVDAVTDGQDLWTAIGRLPPRQRAVIVLRYYEDLTEDETASVLGCSVGTVKSHCSRAVAKLRLDTALEPRADGRSRR